MKTYFHNGKLGFGKKYVTLCRKCKWEERPHITITHQKPNHACDKCGRVNCPTCGAEMRQTRWGATLKKRGPCYVCPAAEAEYTDEQGNIVHPTDALPLHPYLQAWEVWELEAEKQNHTQRKERERCTE